MITTYSPIPYTFREMIQEATDQNRKGKIFFFNAEDKFDDVEGEVSGVKDEAGQGMFILISGKEIRADRIITLFGRPGPAFDEYDAYGNACMDCTGGYPL
jgi:hypothetical protein